MPDQPAKKATITLDAANNDRDYPAYQLSINAMDGEESGHGYRLMGPKYLGRSRNLRTAELSQRDADSIRGILDEVFPPKKPEEPKFSEMYTIRNWATGKEIRSYTRMEAAQKHAEHLLRADVADAENLRWENSCCNYEGCGACMPEDLETAPPLYIDCIYTVGDSGSKVSEYQIVQTYAFSEFTPADQVVPDPT